jgi:aromatic-amino-acid transaminase
MTTPASPPVSYLPAAKRTRPADDPIFALNAEANARKAKGEPVVNATLGSLLDDAGALAVLPTATRAIREVAPADWAGYAPIAGTPGFLKAVVDDVFGPRRDLAVQAVAAASPGGTGALRHAVNTFLEAGQALLTTSFHWGPYATIADEHDRRVDTFAMFDASGGLDVDALDAALSRHLATQGRALLILNDPCQNPTGYSMSAADWRGAADVIGRAAAKGPVAVVLDTAYAAYGAGTGVLGPITALEAVADRALVLVAWSASKTFTHYGLRVGALVALVPDAAERARVGAALTYACRGTWSNCNRGGMAAVTRLLVEQPLREAVDAERAILVRLLDERVDAFNAAAAHHRLRHPRYDGGFFVTVFTDDADAAAARMKAEGVFVVPIEGALRLGLCSTARTDVVRLVESAARAIR